MTWVSNLKIGRRLAAAFGVLLLLTLVLGIQSVRSLNSTDSAYSHQLDRTGAQLSGVSEMRGHLGNQVAAALRFQLTADPADAQEYARLKDTVAADIVAVTGTTQTADGRAAMAEIQKVHEELSGLYGQAIALRTAGRDRRAHDIVTEQSPAVRERLNADIDAFTQRRDKLNAEKSAQLTDSANRTVYVIVALLVASLAIGAVLAAFITRGIVRPLNRLQELAGRAAEGDLTVRADAAGKDEIAQVSRSFDTMVGAMRTAVATVIERARTVGSTASEMAAGSEMAGTAVSEIAATVEGVARGSSEQARSTSDVTATVKEMGAGVQQVAEGGQRAAAMSAEADEAAQ